VYGLGIKTPEGTKINACGLALTLQHHIQRVTALKCNTNGVSTGTQLPSTAAYMFMFAREKPREPDEM